MNRQELAYLLPYLISLLLSISVAAYAWSRRKASGAAIFSWYARGQSLWIGGFIMELISTDLSTKIFWDGFQWITGLFLVIALPVFAIQFTEYKPSRPKTLVWLSLIVPATFCIILLLDPILHWVYLNPHLTQSQPFPELVYAYSPVVYGFAAYSYMVTLLGIYILAQRIIHPHGLYRAQIILVTLGFIIPIAGTILTLLNIYIAPQRDSTPFTAAVSNLIIGWAFYRFRIFEVAPIGRDKVFEAMVEPVVILDNQNNVVDINSAMLALLGQNAKDVIGRPAKIVFDDFPIPIKMYTHVSYARAEAVFSLGNKQIHYELTVWPVYNENKEMSGRIYISHDITALKELEHELRKLNTELEDRVRARTWELAEAYDTTLEGWARALELRDKETEGHSRRVTGMTLKLAKKMDISEEDIEHIRRGAILHDIGKMSISDEILRKPGKLTEEERITIQKHPQTAYDLLSPIPFLNKALEIPYSHHEKWDGTGYPEGLAGREIPLSARIFAVADVWDALSSDRPYNKAWPREKIISFFVEQSGKHFDPYVVNTFLGMVEKGEI